MAKGTIRKALAGTALLVAISGLSFNAGKLLSVPSFYVIEASVLDRAEGICTHQGGALSYTMSKDEVLLVTCSDNIESGENSHFVH